VLTSFANIRLRQLDVHRDAPTQLCNLPVNQVQDWLPNQRAQPEYRPTYAGLRIHESLSSTTWHGVGLFTLS